MIELKIEGVDMVKSMLDQISKNANRDLQTVLQAEGREIVKKVRQNINLSGELGSLLKADIGTRKPRRARTNPAVVIGPMFKKRKQSGKNSTPIAPIAKHMIEGFKQTNRNKTGNKRNHGMVSARAKNPVEIVAATEQQNLTAALNKGLEKLIKKYAGR